ncbi:glycoside hydrolase family 1 protein [Candidatus Babela massiliensis]|uniref:beta-glucosidase n=1 Tax=Candidatus Babela massiliensis TaxID=673862 RepID=V6DJG7_9BACT|nr:family 1 glycosylhydrolase [Candidatus Babela massiliensis]CDK31018.1 Beta-glucosidase family enzyme [Candidatus Babela massiliensis]
MVKFDKKLLLNLFFICLSIRFISAELKPNDLEMVNPDTVNKSLEIILPDNLRADFNWGFAICEYQNSGQEHCSNSNWADWENSKFSNGNSHIKEAQVSGKSCDFWNNYKKDIELMKEMGVSSLRFSVAWDKIEPEQGKFDENALQHYQDLCEELIKSGIKPLISLHHFVHPRWFEQLGGFEKEENIKYFVRFSKKVFNRLSDKVDLWCTINEPNVFMLQGYIRGVFPPGKINPYIALKVLRNLLKAHTEVYKKLKSLPNGFESQIGFIHQYLKFNAYRGWNVIEHIPGLYLNYIVNYLTLNFLKTGKYSVPGLNYEADIERPLDYIGLNYYSRALLKSQLSLSEPIVATCYPDEIMTDMPYAIYPRGFYQAIKDVASIGVPVYITENGIADQKDDRREKFITGYLQAMFDAIKEGVDVRGYYYWTFTDNFEWDEGFLMKFGIFKVNCETQERTFRQGANYLKQVMLAYQNRIKESEKYS